MRETDVIVWGRVPFDEKTSRMADLARECVRLGVSIPPEVKEHIDSIQCPMVPTGERFQPDRHLSGHAFTRKHLNGSGLVEWFPNFRAHDGVCYQSCLTMNIEKLSLEYQLLDVTFTWGGGGFKLFTK